MPRKPLIRTSQYPYHVTIRCNNKEWFDLPLDDVWRMVKTSLSFANKKYLAKVHALVLMGNHYHLLISTPNNNLDKFMYEFNKKLSQQIRHETQRINRIFGDRYKWCLVQDKGYLLNVVRYIYQNPLRARLSLRCEDYPYSTLYYLVRAKDFCLDLDLSYYSVDKDFLLWINQSMDHALEIKLALKKPCFKIPASQTLEVHRR